MPSFFKNTSDADAVRLLGEVDFAVYQQAFAKMSAYLAEYIVRINHIVRSSMVITEPLNAVMIWSDLGWLGPTASGFSAQPWHETLTKAIFDVPDLRLLHLLIQDGFIVKDALLFEDRSHSTPNKAKKATLIDNLQCTGLGGYHLHFDVNDQDLFAVIEALRVRCFDGLFQQPKKTLDELKRVSQMRQHPTEVKRLGKIIVDYTLQTLNRHAFSEVVEQAPVLADLLGLDKTGYVSFDTWANPAEPFRAAGQSLFLENIKAKGEASVAAESAHLYDVQKTALALTVLPAQIFILRGQNPQAVMDGVRRRLEFIYTHRHGLDEFTARLIETGVKRPFHVFPRLWPQLGIQAEDYLGATLAEMEGKDVPEHYRQLNDSLTGLSAFVTHPAFPFTAFVDRLHEEGVDLCDPTHIQRLGFAGRYPVDLATIPEPIIDQIVAYSLSCLGSMPNIVVQQDQLTDQGLQYYVGYAGALMKACQRQTMANLFYDLVMQKPDIVSTMALGYVNPKRPFLSALGCADHSLFEEVFTRILGATKQNRKAINLMFSLGMPRREDIGKLPWGKRVNVLEHDLGL